MKIHATGGTDGGNIVLFWPQTLTENFDQTWGDDPTAAIDELHDNVIWFPCGGDGEFPASIFVDLEVPPELMAECRDPWGGEPWKYEFLEVHGDGYYGGAEYMFKDKSRFEEGSLDRVKIPKGTYTVTVYEVPDYDELRKKWIRNEAGIVSVGLSKIFLLSACVAAISLVISCCVWRHFDMLLLFLSIAVVFGTLASFLSKTRRVDKFFDAEAEAKKVFPAFVAEFKSVK